MTYDEEMKYLATEEAAARKRIEEIDRRRKEIDFELSRDACDPFADKWFIITIKGRGRVLFHSEKSLNDKSKYDNIRRVNRSDGEVWAPISFKGEYICLDDGMESGRELVGIQARDMNPHNIGLVETRDAITILVTTEHTTWLSFMDKADVLKFLAEYTARIIGKAHAYKLIGGLNLDVDVRVKITQEDVPSESE